VLPVGSNIIVAGAAPSTGIECSKEETHETFQKKYNEKEIEIVIDIVGKIKNSMCAQTIFEWNLLNMLGHFD